MSANPNIAALLYLVAGSLFILALKGLSSPATSRSGNRNGMIGMTIAVATTLWIAGVSDVVTWALVIGGLGIGGLIGASMGGQVALLTAAHKPPVRAVAAFFAPTDLARWREGNPFIRDYLDDLCGPEGLPVRSPILRVAQIEAPVLLIHGDQDENVSVTQSIAMEEALKSHGKEVETFIVPGATHFFTEQQNALARRRLFDFLRRHLNRS
ncbi:MAG: NAD(P)(+) transhydrogenase (Re/Si-specific) subunit beta [Alphaproteobacteria bacterium]|nr:NAD(P)(+) transhydrogenase (Re/Si-specific) subunit beta [Alphaproteobacteria bacterium]